MPVNHILSTDSIHRAIRAFYPASEDPILYKSASDYEDLIGPQHPMPEEEHCVKGYITQSELVGTQLMNVISSFVNSQTSLIVEGVNLSVDSMMRIVPQFSNVIPFLIYIKKERFHEQRFASGQIYDHGSVCKSLH
jgi:2-phosphoglycerate kinase